MLHISASYAFPALPEVLGLSISLWLCWDLAEIMGRLGLLSTLLRSVFIPDPQHEAWHKVECVGRMDERKASKILKFLGTRGRVNLVECHHWRWDRQTKQIWKWLSLHTPKGENTQKHINFMKCWGRSLGWGICLASSLLTPDCLSITSNV